jgi:hypothetical protein
MLKIMIIPANSQKSAQELSAIFIQIYDTLLKCAPEDLLNEKIALLLNNHLEAAFKVTTRTEPTYKNRAYMWLLAIIEACPDSFWTGFKRRTLKSLYTHAVDTCRTELETEQTFQ